MYKRLLPQSCSKFYIMKLYNIVKESSFRISRKKRDMLESFYSVIQMLTGQYFNNSNITKHHSDLLYKLINKYLKRKVNKEKFLEVEREWLERQEVNIWK